MRTKIYSCTSLKNSKGKKDWNKGYSKGCIYVARRFDFNGDCMSETLLTRKLYLDLRFKEYIDKAYSVFAEQSFLSNHKTPEPVNVSQSSFPLFSKLSNFTNVISFSFTAMLAALLLNFFSSTFLANLFNNTFVLNSLNISFTIAILSLFLFIYLKSDAILKHAGKTILPLTFLAMPLMAQNQVTGHVQSVPNKSNAFARVTMTDTSNGTQYTTLTNQNTGDFELNIPAGGYQRKVEVQDHFLFQDTLDINSSQYMDLQTIQDIGKETTFYDNILEVLKVITGTRGYPFGNYLLERWHDEDQPIKVWKRNYDANDPQSMPPAYAAFLDSAVNDIFNKSNGKVVFSEQPTAVDIGINFIYVHSNEMPIPGSLGYTIIEEVYPDNSPKKAKIYINRDNLSGQQKNGTFRREFMRSLATINDALDPSYIMAWQSQAEFLHPDEGKALEIMYTLKNGTDMKPHQYTVIQDPVPVELTEFNAKTDDNIVKLLWKTATEVNNYGFEIQRKQEQWDSIGFVAGNGNSNSPKDYAFADTLEMPGVYTYRLKQVDNDGTSEYSSEVQVDLTKIIKDYIMMQNYPNPFNPTTSIQYAISSLPDGKAGRQFVSIKVYDLLGSEIATLVNEEKPAGEYEVKFTVGQDSSPDIASGIYFYRLQAGNYTETKKMVLIR